MAKRESKSEIILPKMNAQQYQGLVNLMDSNYTNLERLFSSEIRGVAANILRLDKTISDHNGRLRDNEKEDIRKEERIKMLTAMLSDIDNKIEAQKNFCDLSRTNTEKLRKLDQTINWIVSHPIKSISFTLFGLSSFLTAAVYLFHLFSK